MLSAIAIGLGLEPRYFDNFCNKRDNNLRLLHYPRVPKSAFDNEAQARAGSHTGGSPLRRFKLTSDYGTITLLFQDDRGGLEVLSPKGTFVPATPIPDTIVVNAGDLLQRWSNDVIRSTEHRVVSPRTPPHDDHFPARYSIAYFCNPNWDATIECLDGCYGDAQGGREKRYSPVNTHEYLVSRLKATY